MHHEAAFVDMKDFFSARQVKFTYAYLATLILKKFYEFDGGVKVKIVVEKKKTQTQKLLRLRRIRYKYEGNSHMG